ncbi:MAG: hypothetical protein Q9219_003394 [cf. Caloplaca sp. 3 TL-2023]
MPRTTFPPTPAPSMDIVGKEYAPPTALSDNASFALPPPAITSAPCSHEQTEEREHVQKRTGSGYALPPPPTRTRKIIQMTPKMDPRGDATDSSTEARPAKIRQTVARASAPTPKATGKKQPSSTSQAGKRIARKTAHSVIERRRRSKMNEEFGVLKNMIPACRNQEMHKLAILQASIEYLRYLEQCVTELKAANGAKAAVIVQRSPPTSRQSTRSGLTPGEEVDDDDDEDSDLDMIGTSGLPSPMANHHTQTPTYINALSANTSPTLDGFRHREIASYGPSLSTVPSPGIGSQPTVNGQNAQPGASSASISPDLMPASSKAADKEATEALLMLNKDRRNTNTGSSNKIGRGMSVKDLLSS